MVKFRATRDAGRLAFRIQVNRTAVGAIGGLDVLGNFSDLPRVESHSYTLRVERPSPAEILGLVIVIVILAAGLFIVVHYVL